MRCARYRIDYLYCCAAIGQGMGKGETFAILNLLMKTQSKLSLIAALIFCSLTPFGNANESTEQKCKELPSKSKRELWELSNCYFKAESYQGAMKTLQEITTRFPEDLDAFFISSFNIWKRAVKLGGEKKGQLEKDALKELNRASILNPTHWRVFLELGDFQYLRLKKPENAYKHYMSARQYYEGDASKKVEMASKGLKSAIENRIARTNEALDRRGEAVSASCLSLHWDPDNKEAQERLARLSGSCKRKDFRNHITGTRQEDKKDAHTKKSEEEHQ